MLKAVYNTDNKKKYRTPINVIKSGLSDLKFEIEKMSEIETEIEKQYEIVDRQNQEGQGQKILPPYQMLSRLPISLAQLKAGKTPKNDIRKLLYS